MSMKSGRLILRWALDNGLALELWDHSRLIAGDRWMVSLETRIVIPIKAETLPPDLKPQADQVIETLGREVVFSQRDERNFIAATAVPDLLGDMQERILQLAPGYFGHVDFAARYIRKTYAGRQSQLR
jgi:hypothetical protein